MEQSKRKQLLKLIESDCRLSVEEYAVMLGEDEVIVSAEIKRMEEEKIICGYRALIDWDKVEDDWIEALVEVKRSLKARMGIVRSRNAYENFLKSNPSFLSAAALILFYCCKDAILRRSQNSSPPTSRRSQMFPGRKRISC